MVFGFGEGKIDILIPKNNFLAGETIQGTVKLSLNQLKKAKQLRIRIVCEEEYWTTTPDPKGGVRTQSNKRNLYSFEQALDTEKEYPKGDMQYPFSIQVPSQSVSTARPVTQLVLGGLNPVAMMGNNSRIK